MQITRRYMDVPSDQVDVAIEIAARWLIQPKRTRLGATRPRVVRSLGVRTRRERGAG